MSLGTVPYSNCANLSDVAERIKAGHLLDCPANCSREIYTELMQSCWNHNPSRRPSFQQLCHKLLELGAVNAESQTKASTLATQVSSTEWKGAFEDRALLGPSIHHLSRVLQPQIANVIQVVTCSAELERFTNLLMLTAVSLQTKSPQDATISDTVKLVVNAATKRIVCPRDGQLGCAYVDSLRRQDDVGRADALLSYTWSYRILSVVKALERWAVQQQRELKRTYIWICALCLNQVRLPTCTGEPNDANLTFSNRLTCAAPFDFSIAWRKIPVQTL